MPNYRTLSLAASTLWAMLFLVLAFAPGVIGWLFHLDGAIVGDVLALRAAMLFLGLATIAYLGRDEPDSSLRRTVALGLGLAMAGLACTGLYEVARGVVGVGIWVAIIIETLLAAAYLWHACKRADAG